MQFIRIWIVVIYFSLILIINFSCDSENPLRPFVNNKDISLVWSKPVENLWKLDVESVQPLINDGRVYYVADTSLICRELNTGKLIWNVGLGNLTRSIKSSKLLYSDGKLFLNDSEFLRSYNSVNGDLLWDNNDSEVRTSTTLARLTQMDNFLFVPNKNKFYKVSSLTGETNMLINLNSKIPNRVPGRVGEISVSQDNFVYLPTGYFSNDIGIVEGNIFCYNGDTGEYIWEYNRPNKKFLISGRPDSISADAATEITVLSNNYVYSMGGHSVSALNRYTGELKWEKFFEVEGFSWTGLFATNDMLFVGGQSGKLYSLNIETGDILWSTSTITSILNSFLVKDGKIFLNNRSGSGIWIIDEKTGTVLWRDRGENVGGYFSPVEVGEGYMVVVGSTHVFAWKLN